MKNLYKITLIALISLFTHSSFSQIFPYTGTLPYTAGTGTTPINAFNTDGWDLSLWVGTTQLTGTFVQSDGSGEVSFSGSGTPTQLFQGTAIKEITAIGNVTTLNMTATWVWTSGDNRVVKFYIGDGTNWDFVSNLSSTINLNFQNPNNYTFVKIVLQSTSYASVALKTFTINASPTGVETNALAGYAVYTSGNNLTIVNNTTTANATLTVTSLSGQVVLNKQLTHTGKIDLNLDLPTGVYVVNIATNNGTLTKKVVVE